VINDEQTGRIYIALNVFGSCWDLVEVDRIRYWVGTNKHGVETVVQATGQEQDTDG
jgi:hypothetical protein